MQEEIERFRAACVGLTPEQLAAVNHTDGTLLVFAGAGSGKTRVIILRAARLILEGICLPEHMLLCTFTNKAASEMRKRLKDLIGDMADKVRIDTMHSVCASFIHIKSPKKLIDDKERKALLGELFMPELLEKMPEEKAVYEISGIATAISHYKNNLVSPVDAIGKYAEHYKIYSKHTGNNIIDFDELIYRVVKVYSMPQHKAFVEQIRNSQYRYVFVDEFQDTNMAQAEFIRIISGYKNLCVVGDDNQAIYGWRGAKVDIIQNFARQNPQAMIINLQTNFRSYQNVLDAAYSVVRHVSKKVTNTGMEASKSVDGDNGALLSVQKCTNCYVEASYIASKIASLKEGGRHYSDCAVLVRTNYQKNKIEQELEFLKIPFIDGDSKFFERLEISQVIDKLNDEFNINNDVHLSKCVENIVLHMGYDLKSKSEEVRALKALVRLVRLFNGDTYQFLEQLHQGVVAEPVIESDKVFVSTVHGAKGLEFNFVFLAGMENGVFPTKQALKSHEDWLIDEERRLCYVGMTRAMEKLYVSYCEYREKDGLMQNAVPSIFLDNLIGSSFKINEPLVEMRTVKDELAIVSAVVTPMEPTVDEEPLVIGNTVYHQTKGFGKILNITDKGYHATVRFKSAGVLTVILSTLAHGREQDPTVDIPSAVVDNDIVFVN